MMVTERVQDLQNQFINQSVTNEFILPGLLSANLTLKEAKKNFETKLDWNLQDGYQKVIFEIELDQTARDTRLDPNLKVKSDCMKMNNSVSFTEKEDQVMFVMPKFDIVDVKDAEYVTMFYLKQ